MARCQVCDGPVVNGRCKLCGMPYRNDEVLYHLNESRSDHYKHATIKARQEMRMEQLPLPDRKSVIQPPAGRLSAQPQKNTASGRSSSGNTGKKNTGKKRSWISYIIPAVIILGTVLPAGVDYIDSKLNVDVVEELSGKFRKETALPGTEEMSLLAIMDADNQCVQIGTVNNGYYLRPGDYVLESSDGRTLVNVTRAASGEVEVYKFYREGRQKVLELFDGDQVAIASVDNKYNYIFLYGIQQNAE